MKYAIRGLAFVAALFAVLVSGKLSHGAQQILSYDLHICEDYDLLQNPMNMNLAMMAAWKTQHELLAARDAPFFELKNTSSDPSSKITRMKISLGDVAATANFDTLQMLYTSPGVTYSIVGLDQVQGGLRSDTLEIVFTGFTPGSVVRFRSDIDCDAGNPDVFCDYRTMLFDMNGNSKTDNASVKVNFTSAVLPGVQIPLNRLPDYAMTAPTTTGIGFKTGYQMDHVEAFGFADQVIRTTVVPEPSSIVACGAALMLGLVGYRSRKKKV
jgi:hypothetical protein